MEGRRAARAWTRASAAPWAGTPGVSVETPAVQGLYAAPRTNYHSPPSLTLRPLSNTFIDMSAGNVLTLRSGNPEETLSIGESIGKRLRPGAVVLLIGPLGAGKTTLAKGIARGLGIEEEIISPTYTIVCEYSGAKPLHHIDLYRVEGREQMESLGLDDILFADGISLVEWGEKLPADFPVTPVRIDISMGGVEPRPRGGVEPSDGRRACAPGVPRPRGGVEPSDGRRACAPGVPPRPGSGATERIISVEGLES